MASTSLTQWKFCREDFERFEHFERTALSVDLLKDSVEYLMDVRYRLKDFLIDRKMKMLWGTGDTGVKVQKSLKRVALTEMRILLDKQVIDLVPAELLETLDQMEITFVLKFTNLMEKQFSRLKFQREYYTANYPNDIKLSDGGYRPPTVEILKSRFVWLFEPERIELLYECLCDLQLVEEKSVQFFLGHFCDRHGNLFTNERVEKIRWMGKMSELTYLTRKMTYGAKKLIEEKDVWVKTAGIYLNKDGNIMSANNLQSSSQTTKPKSKAMLDDMLQRVRAERDTRYN